MKHYSTAIIGGGAAGLFCAALLAQKHYQNFILVERGDRLGKKLSSTGNGQGNVTNANMGVEHYFSDSLDKVENILSDFDEKRVISFLESLGGLFEADEKGRVYPLSKQASSVTDLLRGYLAYRGVENKTGFFVKEIRREKDRFLVKSETEEFTASSVVLCCGGKAQKNFGSDGNGYALAQKFGHTVTELYPSLVQVKTDTDHIKTLKGIRADVRLTAKCGGKVLHQTQGDVIFTEYGISGNAVFYLSPYLTDKEKGEIEIEFLPSVAKERLKEALKEKRANRKDIERSELLGCFLNNQIGRAIMKRCASDSLDEIVDTVKRFRLQYKGTLGFDYAQVTKGGVPLSQTDENLQSKKQKGLYLCGEILNVDGECGGYNLQWAFSSAYAVAKGLLKI